jgi:hypothetical protein
MFGRLARVISVAALASTISVTPAFAGDYSQGRTTGGTAYGVSGEIEIRRPAIGPNQYTATMRVVNSSRDQYHFMGYEVNGDAGVSRRMALRTYDDGRAVYVYGSSFTNPPSRQRLLARIVQVRDGQLRFEDTFGFLVDHFTSYARFSSAMINAQFPVRTYYLDRSNHYFLNYQASLSSTDFRPWGSPVYKATSVEACGNFNGTTNSYSSAFAAPC